MNKEIKLAMFEADLKQFELAKLLGLHEGNLSKMLNRQELSEEKKQKILEVIRNAKEENTNE